MSKGFLLDTNILSYLIRRPNDHVAAKLAQHRGAYICTSIVVACELRFGVEKSASEVLRQRVEQMLSCLEILPFEPPADTHYAQIRNALERRGTPIGPNDLFIAAQALEKNLTLVTDNTDEFCRVDGLSVENWIR